jgi:hypothetical protein
MDAPVCIFTRLAPRHSGRALGEQFHQCRSMNSKLLLIVSGLLIFWTSRVYSDPKPLGRSSNQKQWQQNGTKAEDDLVHRLVQIAREKFEAGKFEAADKILRAALEIQPRNHEAWYYSDLLQKAIEANKDRRSIRLWYPTIPPRPADK